MDDAGEGAPELRDYVRIVWRHRWLISLTVVISVLAAFGFSARQPSSYKATAQLIIQRSDALGSSQQNADDAARNVDTEAAILRSRAVLVAAEKQLGHTPDISVSSSAASDVVNVSATSNNAEQAAKDANVYANTYVALRKAQNIDDLLQAVQQINVKIAAINSSLTGLRTSSVQYQSGQEQVTSLREQRDQLQLSASLSQVAGARVLAPATVPGSPVSPKPLRNAAIAFVLGLLLAIGLAFLREYLDDTITSREELARATDGLTVLGEIPRVAHWQDRDDAHLVTAAAPNSPTAESYRTLRTSIEFVAFDREIKSIQITSSQSDDGKSTTLANLALAFARSGVQVTIVCCDLRRPRVHEFFGLQNEVGFTSVLLGRSTLTDALQRVDSEPNLAILSSGPPPPNPSELLSSGRAAETLTAIEKSEPSGLVFIDTPPVLAVGDALIVSGRVDATLLVAGAGSSSRRALRRTVQMLRQVDAPLIGTVLNNAQISGRDSAYGYGYSAPNPNGNGSSSNSVLSRRLHRKDKSAAS